MMPKKVSRKSRPATREVVEETTEVRQPVKTAVRTPGTLAEALTAPVVEVPEEQEETTRVVSRVVRRKRAA